MDLRFSFDILSPLQAHKCRAFDYRHNSHMGRALPRLIDDLPKKIILENNSLKRIIQLVRLVTLGSQVRSVFRII
jgi:hypothetical protein